LSQSYGSSLQTSLTYIPPKPQAVCLEDLLRCWVRSLRLACILTCRSCVRVTWPPVLRRTTRFRTRSHLPQGASCARTRCRLCTRACFAAPVAPTIHGARFPPSGLAAPHPQTDAVAAEPFLPRSWGLQPKYLLLQPRSAQPPAPPRLAPRLRRRRLAVLLAAPPCAAAEPRPAASAPSIFGISPFGR